MKLKNYAASFKHAFRGMSTFSKAESNAKLHLILAIFAVGLSALLNISKTEWLFILGAIALVFIVEMINTAIEQVCNKITIERDQHIKQIKDISAASVVVACIFALLVAAIIWLPKLFN